MALKGAIAGLAKIKEKAESKQSFGDGESPFLTVKDGESYKIRFLQELEEDSPEYDPRRGLLVVVEEHTHPKDFKRRAVCTMEEEGKCWACEQTQLPEIGKKWRPRMRFYANVVVRGDEDKVKILAQGFGPKNVGQSMIELATEYGSLGGQDAKLLRKGSGMNDTAYSLMPLAPKAMSKEDKGRELLDLSKFIKYVAYADQADFYNGTADTESKEEWV